VNIEHFLNHLEVMFIEGCRPRPPYEDTRGVGAVASGIVAGVVMVMRVLRRGWGAFAGSSILCGSTGDQ